MKKLFVILLCAAMASAITACGNNNEPDQSSTASVTDSTESNTVNSSESSVENESSQTVSDESENTNLSESIIRAEKLYKEDDANYALIEGLQGKIKYIEQDSTSLVFLADNKIYLNEYGTLAPKFELPGNPQWIQYFNNMEIGANVYYYSDNKISLYDDNGAFRFKDMDFNIETDCAYADMGNTFFVLSEQSNGYMIKYYEVDNERTVTKYEENMLTKYIDVSGEDITDQIKEVKIIPSNEYGFEVYCITSNNELYWANDINRDILEMSTGEPILTNVDTVYASSNVTTYTTAPIYSKVGDETTVYSMVPGASLAKSEDNLEISFPMPDGHLHSEIKNIFESYGTLVFVFSNGDTYITDEIEDDKQAEYQMTKLDEISKLNADGKVVDMVGVGSVFDKYIYLLTDTNELYAYIIE